MGGGGGGGGDTGPNSIYVCEDRPRCVGCDITSFRVDQIFNRVFSDLN